MLNRQIYLAPRHPSTTHEEFISNWREHIALGGKFPSMYRRFTDVAQCDVILDPALTGDQTDVPGGFDGIEFITARDLPASLSVWDDPNVQNILIPDERRVFANVTRELTLYALGSVILDGPRTPYIVARLLSRDPALSREDFIREWAALPGPEHPAVRRYVRDFIILDPPPGVPFDGVEEIWFDTVADMAAYLRDDERRDRASEDRLMAAAPLVLPTRVGIAFPPISP